MGERGVLVHNTCWQKHHYLTNHNSEYTPKIKEITDKYDFDLNGLTRFITLKGALNMKYLEFMTNAGSFKSKKLVLFPVDMDIIDYYETNKVKLEEPVPIEAHYYKEDNREEDFIGPCNPFVVSENFKELVEELDPNAAQFFTTKCINCVTQKKYYLMHITQVISCLDKEHSTFFPDMWDPTKEQVVIGAIDSSLVPENVHMFRLGENASLKYVSEVFYRQYRKRRLRGCSFLPRTWIGFS